MYNKLLADLIRGRLNNELEKIKLELFEDDYYAEDIEDSIDVVRNELAVPPKDEFAPVPALNPTPVLEALKEPVKLEPVVKESPPVLLPAESDVQKAEEYVRHGPAIVKEVDLEKTYEEVNLSPSITQAQINQPQVNQQQAFEQKVEYMASRGQRFDPLKVSAGILFLTLVGLTGYLMISK